MPNWTPIVQADISGSKIGDYLTAALADGFDLPGTIADVVSRIRSAVSKGNVLDADPTKIPNSLKGLARSMVVLRMKDFLDQSLTDTDKVLAQQDNSYLIRICDERLKFEQADNPAGSAEMQSPAPIQVVTSHRPVANYRNLHGLT
jgi:hypothetical protein